MGPKLFRCRVRYFLRISQSDPHFFESNLIKRAGDLDAVGVLILSQSVAGCVIEFSGCFAGIKRLVLQQLLSGGDLILCCAEDRFL